MEISILRNTIFCIFAALFTIKQKDKQKEGYMCQVSKATILHANRRLIERKGVRLSERVVSSNGDFHVSVFSNGKLYTQVITKNQIREAYGKALAKNKANHGAKL